MQIDMISKKFPIMVWILTTPMMDTQIFKKFIQLVNNQINFNKDGKINAIPIIGYHNIEDDKAITSKDVSLFDAEMKYLHDNRFKVLTMSDLGYENSNYLYVKK